MLLNRLIERVRRLFPATLLLGRRASLPHERRPVILIPGMMGTRLEDVEGRILWGTTRRLYQGPTLSGELRAAGLLEGLTVVPWLYAIDIYGGMLRFLEQVGGYRRDEDLFVLDYDWRTGAEDGAAALAALVARVRGAGDERLDLVAASTGGLVARAYLARAGNEAIARVVYVAAPQRGTFDALACLHRGYRFVPGGKRFSGQQAAAFQTTFDALPHPEESVFVDTGGQPLDVDLYDPDAWVRLGVSDDAQGAAFAARLERARRLHGALDDAAPHPDVVAIGATHLPTPSRVVIAGGRAHVPRPTPGDDPHARHAYGPGDGELPESSLRGLPGLSEDRVWLARPRAHHLLLSDPAVHQLILEALLITSRPVPEAVLARGRLRVVRTP